MVAAGQARALAVTRRQVPAGSLLARTRDVYHPLDAEPVLQRAELVAPRLLLQRELTLPDPDSFS